MKKKIFALTLAIAIAATALTGCGGSKSDSSPADNSSDSSDTPDVEAITLKVNLTQNTSDPWYEWWTDWANRVEEASEGTLKLELYTGQSLGASRTVSAAQRRSVLPAFRNAI